MNATETTQDHYSATDEKGVAENEMPEVSSTMASSRPPICDQEYYILHELGSSDRLLKVEEVASAVGLKRSIVDKYLSGLTLRNCVQCVTTPGGLRFKITEKGLRVSGRVDKREQELGDTTEHQASSGTEGHELGDTDHTQNEGQEERDSIVQESTNSLLIDYPKGKASERNTNCNTESPGGVIQNVIQDVIRPQKRKIGRPSMYELDRLDNDIKRLYPDHSEKEIAREIGCHRNIVSNRVVILIKKRALQPKRSHEAAMKREQSRKAKAINQTINHGRTKTVDTGEQPQDGQKRVLKQLQSGTDDGQIIPMVKPSVQSSNGSKLVIASAFIEEVRRLGADRGFDCGFSIEYDDMNVDLQDDGLICIISMEASIQGNGGKKGVRRL